MGPESGSAVSQLKPWITAVVAAGLVLSCAQPKDSPEEVIARLVAAAGEYRPFMPRISGGFNHSKCDVGAAELELSSVMCGKPLPTGFDDVAQLVSASTGKHGPSLDVDRMRAIWRLQWVSVAGNLDGAIDLLSGIVTAGEADPRVHNDLAAAFLVRSSIENDPADLFRALGAVTRALAVDSLFPEALYNRAMTLQLLGFRGRASEAWRSYVEVEPNREWRNEGVRILERLESENFLIPFDSVRALALDTNIPPSDVVPYMSPHLASFRQLLFSKFIPSWAMHLSSGDSAAAFGEWENSVRLANLLEEASHDEFPRAVMVALELSGREADLVAAIDLLREGIESFDAFRYTEAGPKLEAAREMLGALHQPLALWAQ
ncbi:MAG: hypothetical protein OEZ54_05455, partial [Gemmatimonadota bacterium]|nr:hypothetical protein [Gemmatimonadota bacterium]